MHHLPSPGSSQTEHSVPRLSHSTVRPEGGLTPVHEPHLTVSRITDTRSSEQPVQSRHAPQELPIPMKAAQYFRGAGDHDPLARVRREALSEHDPWIEQI